MTQYDPYDPFNPLDGPPPIEGGAPPDQPGPAAPPPPFTPATPAPTAPQAVPPIALKGLKVSQALVDAVYPGYSVQGDALVWTGAQPPPFVPDQAQAQGRLKAYADPLNAKDWKGFFNAVYGQRGPNQTGLLDPASIKILKAGGFNMSPANQSGFVTKIQAPDQHWYRVIDGDPQQGGAWSWIDQGTGSGPGGGGLSGDLTAPFNDPFDTTPSPRPTLPGFDPPPIPNLPAFKPPTADDVFADPSYNFRKDQGEQALTNNASAAGLLRSSGTLKDFLKYNQNFASQEYGQVFDRSLQGYDRSIANLLGTSDRAQSRAAAIYDPEKLKYTTEFNDANRTDDRRWQEYLFRADAYWKNQQNLYDRMRNQNLDAVDAIKAGG